MKRALLARIAPLWVAGLVAVSLQPWRPGTPHDGTVHGVLHFLAYLSTALLLAFAARGARQRIHAGLEVVALGAAIEYAQHLLYRGAFEWGDLASDVCAALLAGLPACSRTLRETLVR
jgi:VanZ family protein